ncbi:MAG TPA: hypothetical protein PKZ16_01645 [bacterium]|nr:hypothetical protein [bacterium]HPL95537.1 hypothetical protein [bacterium]
MLPPQFFDIFGIICFCYIIILSFFILKKYHQVPRWCIIILLLIGIAGLIVDGFIVYQFYLK